MTELTHFDEQGNSRMVDVSQKDLTKRIATATGEIKVSSATIERIKNHKIKKGDVMTVAQVAGIMAAKKTSDLIPMCHNINLTGVDLTFEIDDVSNKVNIRAIAKTVGKTGVEIEALTAVSVAALTIYDMCKAMDKDMVIGDIKLLEKTGGKSGHYIREV